MYNLGRITEKYSSHIVWYIQIQHVRCMAPDFFFNIIQNIRWPWQIGCHINMMRCLYLFANGKRTEPGRTWILKLDTNEWKLYQNWFGKPDREKPHDFISRTKYEKSFPFQIIKSMVQSDHDCSSVWSFKSLNENKLNWMELSAHSTHRIQHPAKQRKKKKKKSMRLTLG